MMLRELNATNDFSTHRSPLLLRIELY